MLNAPLEGQTGAAPFTEEDEEAGFLAAMNLPGGG